jgi:hypothetical protein
MNITSTLTIPPNCVQQMRCDKILGIALTLAESGSSDDQSVCTMNHSHLV